MKESSKNKLKKQIVSGGVYIALAAAVVTVTMNGVKNIIGSSEDYEISDTNIQLPKIDKKDSGDVGDIVLDLPKVQTPEINFELPTKNDAVQKNNSSDNNTVKNESDSEIAKESGTSSEGITTDIIALENTDNNNITQETPVSGEPDDVEYPTEPETVSYDVYAKPAEGYIDKEYSDTDLIYSVTMGDYRTHNGVDITGDPGSAVKAINSGIISNIYYDEFYGHTIEIDHGNGLVAYYMNLSESKPNGIKIGAKVSHGQTIGGIGNSAVIESAEVSHLHLSIRVNGELVDPRLVLRGTY